MKSSVIFHNSNANYWQKIQLIKMKPERMSHRVDGMFSKPNQFMLQKVPITIFLSSKSGKRSRLNTDKLGMNLLGNVNKPMNLCVAHLFWKPVHLYNWSVLTFLFSFSSFLPFIFYSNQHIFSKTVVFILYVTLY